MRPGGIVVSLAVALLCFTAGQVSGATLFFDYNNDNLADQQLAMSPGDVAVVGIYLDGFTQSTGSFQFDLDLDSSVLGLLDYDAYLGQSETDPGLVGPISTVLELGPWATSQWSDPVTQESCESIPGGSQLTVFYTGGSLSQTGTGDGVLALVVFEALAAGETTLTLTKPGDTWYLEGVEEQPSALDLDVVVIPEPCSIGLACVAALGLLRAVSIRPRRRSTAI